MPPSRSSRSALGAVALLLAAAAASAAPRACRLLSDGLPAYFATDMPRLVDTPALCAYGGSKDDQTFVTQLALDGFAQRRDLRAAFATACDPTPDKIAFRTLRIHGADGACGWEQFVTSAPRPAREAVVALRRGRILAHVVLSAPYPTTLAKVEDATSVARAVLGRWRRAFVTPPER